MSMVAAASMDAVDEQRDLKKYFPAVDRNAIFCIGCASNGHRFAACPLRNCRLCGGITVDHTLFGCPAVALDTLTQSDKRSESELKPLHGTGKDKPKNKNKAAAVSNTGTAAPGQPSQCPYCLEECIHEVVCPRLWTTFVSDPASKRSDYKIWTACYVCGLDNHFGGDCKSNTGMHLSGRQFSRDDDIWSHKYASLFSEMKKSRSCAKVEAAGNGAGSAAVAPQSRKAKRLKAGQDDKIVPTHSSQVHSASQAAKSGNTGSNESSKSTGKKEQAPTLLEMRENAVAPCDQTSSKTRTSKRPRTRQRSRGKQKAAVVNAVLPDRSAAPVPATSATVSAQTEAFAQETRKPQRTQVRNAAAFTAVAAQPVSEAQRKEGGQAQALPQPQTQSPAAGMNWSSRRQRRIRNTKLARAGTEAAGAAIGQTNKAAIQA